LLARQPRLGFLGAWVFLTLAPTSSFLPIATEVGAERRMYLPLVGVIALIVIGAMLVWDRIGRRAFAQSGARGGRPAAGTAVLIVVCVLLGTRTILRNREYRSPLAMARTVLERWPSANAEYLVGTELGAAGRHEEAIPHLLRAAVDYAPARFALGSELLAVGRPSEAIEQLELFVSEEPDLLATRSAYVLLGRAYESSQQWPRAIEQYRMILQRDGSDVEAHGLLADALREQQAFDEAASHYRTYLAARPEDANAWTGLGIALVSTGKTQEAVAAFRGAVRAGPGNTGFRINLARALLDTGALDEAAVLAQQTAATDPASPAPYDILARVSAARGDFSAARQYFQQSLARDRQYPPAVEGLRALSGRR
jgi:tetratricopeptide (TPR) repeat protein